MEWHKFKAAIALKCVVFNDNWDILLLKRPAHDFSRPNGFDIPGGGMETAENVIEGLRREIREEAGLEVRSIEPFDVETFTENDGCTTVMIGFSAKAVDSDITLSPEHDSFQWATQDLVLDSDLPDVYKRFVIKAFTKFKNIND